MIAKPSEDILYLHAAPCPAHVQKFTFDVRFEADNLKDNHC